MIEMLIERCALSGPQNHIARESDGLHNRFHETIVNITKGVKIPLASLNKVMLNI